jgi:hypothetical protein
MQIVFILVLQLSTLLLSIFFALRGVHDFPCTSEGTAAVASVVLNALAIVLLWRSSNRLRDPLRTVCRSAAIFLGLSATTTLLYISYDCGIFVRMQRWDFVI